MTDKLKGLSLVCLLGGILGLPAFLTAGEIIILNTRDLPGEGLNDETVVAPVGGNPGTTLGEQRLNVIRRAGEIWLEHLDTDQDIVIRAETSDLTCDNQGAVFASAGPNLLFRDFTGAPFPATYYPVALANQIAGRDLSGGHDINLQFNLNLDDDPTCNMLTGGWYYGYDHNHNGSADLLVTLLHEFGHGLGFAEFSDPDNGELFDGFPDIYNRMVMDLSTGKHWHEMTDGERLASQTNDPNVVWTGANATAAGQSFLLKSLDVRVTAPGNIAGTLGAVEASFGSRIRNDISAELVLADDGGVVPSQACGALINNVSGKLVLIDRGSCEFGVKVLNAEQAGAVGVIVANNIADAPIVMGAGAVGNQVTIPSVMISLAEGNTVRSELPGVMATFGRDPNSEPAGTNQGFVRIYAPDPFDQGSSISHWTTATSPNLLMEPNLSVDLGSDLDITLDHFKDIGWSIVEQVAPEPRLLYSWLSNNALFNSRLILNNLGDTVAEVTLEARRNDGEPPLVAVRQISPLGFLEETGADLFPALGDGGGFTVLANSVSTQLAGRWVTNSLQSESMASPAQGIAVELSQSGNKRLGNSLLFGYLPVDENTTSAPVLVNAGDSDADVVLYFYDSVGNLLLRDEDTASNLAPNRPLAAVISSLLPGENQNVTMIAHSPSQPITGVVFVFDAEFLEPAIGNAQAIEFTPP